MTFSALLMTQTLSLNVPLIKKKKVKKKHQITQSSEEREKRNFDEEA
jgi:hypothetical protein